MDPVCVSCSKPIQGDVLRWGALTFHLDHLQCTKCNVKLGTNASIKNFSGKPYCPNCWNDVFWGPGKAPAPERSATSAPVVVAPPVAPPVVMVAASPAPAPVAVAATANRASADPITAPAHPMKDQIEGAAVLKHVDSKTTHDASAPKIEATVHVKKVDRDAFKAEVTAAHDLKHVDSKTTHDASAPKIDAGVQVKTRPIMERQVFLSSVEKAATATAAATPLERAIKQLESSVKIVEAGARSVETNKQNLRDAQAGAPGASSVAEAQKTLATAEDLYNTQLKNTQVRYNVAANELDRNRSQLTGDLKTRWERVVVGLKQHGLTVV